MILNEIERAVICNTREYRTNADFIDAIEAAVIEKLCAGVSMPEPAGSFHVTHFRQSARMRNIEFQEHFAFASGDHLLYTADQLSTAIAAARLNALEDAAVRSWIHHMEQSKKIGTSPEVYSKFSPTAAIRALKGEA